MKNFRMNRRSRSINVYRNFPTGFFEAESLLRAGHGKGGRAGTNFTDTFDR